MRVEGVRIKEVFQNVMDLAIIGANKVMADVVVDENIDGEEDKELEKHWGYLNADKAPWLTKHIASILALSAIFLSFIMFFILVFYRLEQEKKDVVIYILGMLSAIDSQIISFYFGSSKESEVKNRMLNHQMMQNNSNNNN